MNDIILQIKKVKKDMSPFALLIYEVITESKPEIIFEIGVCKGYSTNTILSALKENKKGMLYSCDVRDRNSSVPDDLKGHWNFKQISSTNYSKEWKLPIDILIIDGDHSYKGAKEDFENYIKFVKKGGYIFFHDTISWEGSKRYFQEIKYPKIHFPWVDGLGLIQKRDD